MSIKEAAIESIKALPDDSTLEDIMAKLNFVGQVLEGLEDSRADRIITTEELLKETEQW